ncbi:hypothetical protein P8625_14220 [Tenacibaculum tangerinum]|uniref:Secreted protein n=1 Tax=Tenacibaculum tangerinum TaxID=3038772 RepID=A0ABY8L3K7_9FLAO|nr:hypothetical protein [Tenacibaculum tangerinum]WGH75212.1 hypothetical protein P8625_14220 [Tenacibaculum tangerinum]
MKKAFHKITSITMAFIVVFSTMSFTVNSHFCGDMLVGTSYFVKAESCGMDMKRETKSEDCSVMKKNCCQDVASVVEGQDTLKITSFDALSFNQQVFIASFYHYYVTLFEGTHDKVISFKNYKPPLVVRDIHVLDEVYLI